MLKYPAIFERDPKTRSYTVTFPDFGWGVTQGDGLPEAERMAADLLCTLVAEQVRCGAEVPLPGRRRGKQVRLIGLAAAQSAKVLLYQAFRSSGLSKTGFAERSGLSDQAVEQLFDPDRATSLSDFEAASRALGKQLVIGLRDAA